MGNKTTKVAVEHDRPKGEVFDQWGQYVECTLAKLLDKHCRFPIAVLSLDDIVLGWRGARAVYLHLLDNSTLREIDLSRNELGKQGMVYVAELIRLCSNIEHIGVSGNFAEDDGVQAIVSSITHSHSLRRIDLSANLVRSRGTVALSYAIQFNHSLTDIDISHNVGIGVAGCRALGDSLRHTYTLSKLAMNSCGLTDRCLDALSKGLRKNRSLTHLRLSGNTFSKYGVVRLIQSLVKARLRLLDLSDNDLGPSGCRMLSASLSYVAHLRTLLLRSNRIGDMGCKYLGEALGSLTGRGMSLKCLDLCDNGIAKEGIEELANVLEDTPGITALDVSFNEFGREGGEALLSLVQHNPLVSHLTFHATCVPRDVQKRIVAAMRNALGQNGQQHKAAVLYDPMHTIVHPTREPADNGYTMESVNDHPKLGDPDDESNPTCIDPEGMTNLIRRLHHNEKGVYEVVLVGQRLACEGSQSILRDLLQALTYNVTVLNLDLSMNSLGEQGTFLLVRALIPNDRITMLSLSGNALGEKGVATLCELLQLNRVLVELRLDHNQMGDKGMLHLTRVLTADDPPAITRMSLQWNRITKDSGMVLNRLLLRNHTLTELSLAGNLLGNNGLLDFTENPTRGLWNNTSLQHIDLGNNAFGDKGAEKLLDAALNNLRLCWVGVLNNQLSQKMQAAFIDLNRRLKLRPPEGVIDELSENKTSRFKPGDEVQVYAYKDDMSCWEEAQIVSWENDLYTIQLTDGTRWHNVHESEVREPLLRKDISLSTPHRFKIGERVMMNLDDKWSPGSIIAMNPDLTYVVVFESGGRFSAARETELTRPVAMTTKPGAPPLEMSESFRLTIDAPKSKTPDELHRSACRIQAVMRGFLARRKARLKRAARDHLNMLKAGVEVVVYGITDKAFIDLNGLRGTVLGVKDGRVGVSIPNYGNRGFLPRNLALAEQPQDRPDSCPSERDDGEGSVHSTSFSPPSLIPLMQAALRQQEPSQAAPNPLAALYRDSVDSTVTVQEPHEAERPKERSDRSPPLNPLMLVAGEVSTLSEDDTRDRQAAPPSPGSDGSAPPTLIQDEKIVPPSVEPPAGGGEPLSDSWSSRSGTDTEGAPADGENPLSALMGSTWNDEEGEDEDPDPLMAVPSVILKRPQVGCTSDHSDTHDGHDCIPPLDHRPTTHDDSTDHNHFPADVFSEAMSSWPSPPQGPAPSGDFPSSTSPPNLPLHPLGNSTRSTPGGAPQPHDDASSSPRRPFTAGHRRQEHLKGDYGVCGDRSGGTGIVPRKVSWEPQLHEEDEVNGEVAEDRGDYSGEEEPVANDLCWATGNPLVSLMQGGTCTSPPVHDIPHNDNPLSSFRESDSSSAASRE